MMSDFVTNISDDSKHVDMFLFGTIGRDLNGDDFARDMISLIEEGVTHLNIYINSIGGSILHGNSIITAMNIARQRGVRLSTINSGVADSMASIILAFGDKGHRKMYDFATSLLHEPLIDQDGKYVKGADVKDESLRNELLVKKESLLTILSGSLSIAWDRIKTLMEESTSVTAEQAKQIGLVDDILQTSNVSESIAAINIKDRSALMVACSDINKNKTEFMDKRIFEILNLSENANNEEIVTSLEELKRKLQELEESVVEEEGGQAEVTDEIDQLKKEKAELEATIEEMKEASQEKEAKDVIDAAIESGRFKAENRHMLINQAKDDIVAMRGLIDSINPAGRVSMVDLVEEETEGEMKSRLGAQFANMYKHDRDALDKLEEEDPAQYKLMHEAYQNSDISIDSI